MRRHTKIASVRNLRSHFKVLLFVSLAILTLTAIGGIAGATVIQIDTTTEITTINGVSTDTSPIALNPGDTVFFEGQVSVVGTPSLPPSVGPQGTITIKYQLEGTSDWTKTVTVPTEIITTNTGSFSGSFIAPLDPGVYNLQAVFKGDNWASQEQHETYHWKNSKVTVLEAFVVPEYQLGALAALGACFVGFAIFKKRSSLLSI